jgi:LacI family transcriptional regulator
MAVTISQVAREAGVSRSTVSLVLGGSTRVAAETRARVQATIERLGYRPSRRAAGLRTRRSYIVGLVVSSLAYPHHARIAMGIEAAVEGRGYSVLVANSRSRPERERRHIETLRRQAADGLVVTPLQITAGEAAHLSALRKEGYPLVTAYREILGLDVDFCGVDTYAAVRQLVAYLAGDLGHRHIAFLAGQPEGPVTPRRIAGWRDELRARGLPADDALLIAPAVEDDATRGTGADGGAGAAVTALLARGTPCTAIACINDVLALSALEALYRAGRRVPEDVSVAGMGGFEEHASPGRSLTTLAFDFDLIGRRAGELLLRRIEHPWAGPVERHIVTGTLRVGETADRAPGRAPGGVAGAPAPVLG